MSHGEGIGRSRFEPDLEIDHVKIIVSILVIETVPFCIRFNSKRSRAWKRAAGHMGP